MSETETNKMTTQDKINELKQITGFNVDVKHYRPVVFNTKHLVGWGDASYPLYGLKTVEEARKLTQTGLFEIAPRGGKIVVELYKYDKETDTRTVGQRVVSKCNPKDLFDSNIGLNIAVGRLYKKVKDLEVVTKELQDIASQY